MKLKATTHKITYSTTRSITINGELGGITAGNAIEIAVISAIEDNGKLIPPEQYYSSIILTWTNNSEKRPDFANLKNNEFLQSSQVDPAKSSPKAVMFSYFNQKTVKVETNLYARFLAQKKKDLLDLPTLLPDVVKIVCEYANVNLTSPQLSSLQEMMFNDNAS